MRVLAPRPDCTGKARSPKRCVTPLPSPLRCMACAKAYTATTCQTSGKIIRLANNDRQHSICWPLLAGLMERQKASLAFLPQLEESRLRLCVACLHCWKPPFTEPADEIPSWHQALLEHRPELVSEVATQCAAAALRNGRGISIYFGFIAKGSGDQPGSQNALLGLLGALPQEMQFAPGRSARGAAVGGASSWLAIWAP